MNAFDDLLNGLHSQTITEVSVLVRELRVRIGILPRPVHIRIYYDPRAAEPYTFEMSAYMRPQSTVRAGEDSRSAASEKEAVRRAVRMLTQAYEDAIRDGQMPVDAWLVDSNPAVPLAGSSI
jgi:hypothetical protein